MSPIVDRQRRLMELGRIRMGAKKETSSGKQYPASLSTWRLTSRLQHALEVAAEKYGGTVEPWENGHYELITETDTLDVMLAPDPVSLWYEQWSGGGCQRRCDGQTETLTGGPCLCSEGEERECKETTRLSVLLPHLPGVGVWRLESHGYNSSTELAATAEYLADAAPQAMLRLRIDPRTVKRDGETKKFVVPVLDTTATLLELHGGEAPAGYTPIERAGVTPAQALEQGKADAQRPRQSRQQAEFVEPDAVEAPPEPIPVDEPTSPAPQPDGSAETAGSESANQGAEGSSTNYISDAQRRRLFALANEHIKSQTPAMEAELKNILRDVTGQESTKAIPKDLYDVVCSTVQAYRAIPFGVLEGEQHEMDVASAVKTELDATEVTE